MIVGRTNKTEESRRTGAIGAFGILAFIILIIMCVVVEPGCSAKAFDDDVTYQGVTNREIRVRTGPGTEYDQVVHGKKLLYLPAQTECVIIDQATASNGKDWYKIIYEIDGEEIEGFVFAEYVAMYELSPTPTPAPTNTPTPTPKPTATPAPTKAADEQPKAEEKKSPSLVPAIAIVLAAAAAGAVIFVLKKKKEKNEPEGNRQNETSKKVDKLKKLKLDESMIKNGHRQVTIKRSTVKEEDDSSWAEELEASENEKPKDSAEDSAKDSTEDNAENKASAKSVAKTDTSTLIRNASKEAEEKKTLRAEIESLTEHEIVHHKLFGEGEVYDNSDIRLIEIRFGNDVRFINKDSLAQKHLLETNEDGSLKRRNAMRVRRTVRKVKRVKPQ